MSQEIQNLETNNQKLELKKFGIRILLTDNSLKRKYLNVRDQLYKLRN